MLRKPPQRKPKNKTQEAVKKVARKFMGPAKKLLAVALKLSWVFVAGALLAHVHDELSLRRATSLVASAEDGNQAGRFAEAKTALKSASERYDWSAVRQGSKASNSGIAATERLMRIPVLTLLSWTSFAGRWKELRAKINQQTTVHRKRSAMARSGAFNAAGVAAQAEQAVAAAAAAAAAASEEEGVEGEAPPASEAEAEDMPPASEEAEDMK